MDPASEVAAPRSASPSAVLTTAMGGLGSAIHISEMLYGREIEELCAIREKAHVERKQGGVIDVEGAGAIDHPGVKRIIAASTAQRQVVWARFVDTPFAFVVHADTGDGTNLEDTMIIIPLDSDPQPAPGTIFFRQRWRGPSANFVRGTPDYPGKVNMTVVDYRDVERLSTTPFSRELFEAHLSHLNPESLEGLSFDAMLPWGAGSAIAFPCTQLHAGTRMRPNSRKRSLILRMR